MKPNSLKSFFTFVPAIFLLLLTGGCEKKSIPLPDHPGGQIFHGIKRFDVRCYRCHGDKGEGTSRAPGLIRPGSLIDQEPFIQIVLNGRDRMPSFISVLSENDILQIIDWLEKVNPSEEIIVFTTPDRNRG